MKRLFLLILTLFCCVSLWAQTIENGNNTSNAPSLNSTIKKEESVLDTTHTIQPVPVSSKSLKETEKKSSQTEFKSVKRLESLESTSTQQQQILSQEAIRFQQAYTNSRQQVTRRSASKLELEQMTLAANTYTVYAPESFEAHFYTYLTHKFDSNYFSHLQKAAQLQPTNKNLQQELFAYSLATNKTELADSLAPLLSNSEGMNLYASDMIQSIPTNGTLLLHGYTDLAPVYSQLKTTKRTDVNLVSLDLLQSKTQQKNLIRKGFKLPTSNTIDTAYFKDFCLLNKNQAIYISLSFPKEYFQTIQNDIQVLGLTFAYKLQKSNTDEMNFALYKKYWLNSFIGKTHDVQSDKLAANYLPALLSAKQYAEKALTEKEVTAIQSVLDQVAQRAKKVKQISEITK